MPKPILHGGLVRAALRSILVNELLDSLAGSQTQLFSDPGKKGTLFGEGHL